MKKDKILKDLHLNWKKKRKNHVVLGVVKSIKNLIKINGKNVLKNYRNFHFSNSFTDGYI